MSVKLEPCPICDKEPIIKEGGKFMLIECKGRDSQLIHSLSTVWFYKEYRDEAIELWNEEVTKIRGKG